MKKSYKIKNLNDVYISRIRTIILAFCMNEPKKMIDIQKLLNISRGSLRYHLNILANFDLIKTMKRDEKKRGRPTFIETNKEQLKKNELKDKIKSLQRKEQFLINYREEILKILELLSQKKEFNREEVLKIIQPISIPLIPMLEVDGFIENKLSITDKGIQFLKKYRN